MRKELKQKIWWYNRVVIGMALGRLPSFQKDQSELGLGGLNKPTLITGTMGLKSQIETMDLDIFLMTSIGSEGQKGYVSFMRNPMDHTIIAKQTVGAYDC